MSISTMTDWYKIGWEPKHSLKKQNKIKKFTDDSNMQTGLRVTITVIELWFYISIDKHLVRDVLVNYSQTALRHRRKPQFVVFSISMM